MNRLSLHLHPCFVFKVQALSRLRRYLSLSGHSLCGYSKIPSYHVLAHLRLGWTQGQGQIMFFSLVNASPPNPLDVATSNFAGAVVT